MFWLLQREIENSYASNADYVHKSVLFTEEGRKRYAEQVCDKDVVTVQRSYLLCITYTLLESYWRARQSKETEGNVDR